MDTLTTQEFEEKVLKADLPVVVDFSASWCGPCKTMKPHLAKAAKQHEGKVLFFVVDVDESDDLARQYKILGIPRLILFVGGKAKGQVDGVSPDPDQDIADLLAKVV